jgi:hypothetical protein
MLVGNPEYGEDIWEWVEPWTPANPGEFAGVYVSDEAETVLNVELHDGKLVIHRRPDSSFELKPTYADAFDCSLGSIHFVRGADGKIIALEAGSSRVWNLRFDRKNDGVRTSGIVKPD